MNLSKTENYNEVGKFLYEWMQNQNLTQIDFSKKLEVSTNYLYGLLNGRQKWSPNMVNKVSAILQQTDEQLSVTFLNLVTPHRSGKKYPIEKVIDKVYTDAMRIETDTDLGDALFLIRKNLGLTQLQAARMLGVDESFVSHSEVGRKALKISTYRKLLEKYGYVLSVELKRVKSA